MDSKAAVEAFHAYTRAFQSGDPQAPVRHFHIPSLMVNPDATLAFTSEADVARAYGEVMARLPRMNYARSEFSDVTGQSLSDDLAVVTGKCAWLATDGSELSRFGVMYTLRRVSGAWKILSAVIYTR